MRLFLAIRLPEGALQEACDVQTTLKGRITRQGVRFTPPHKMHLTLAFLGNDLSAEEADGVAGSALTGSQPFTLTLGFLGAFPDLARPKTIWLGVSGDGLAELAGQVGTAFGLESEPFTGHVTLARVSPASKSVGWALRGIIGESAGAELADVSWLAEEIELIASLPGGEHETVKRYPL